jgi:hypothetical protein
MRPSIVFAVLAALALAGCARGFTPQPGYSSSYGGSAGYNSDYRGGELTPSPLDRNAEMLQ